MSGTHAAASPWQPRADAVALFAWPAGAPGLVAQLLQGAWRAWARDWGLGGAGDDPVACSDASGERTPGDRWTALGQGRGGTAWIRSAADDDVQLAQALFGAEACADTPVVRDIVADCRTDARARLASALQLVPGAAECVPPPRGAWRPWSGALLVSLPLSGDVLLDAALVRAVLPARPAGAGAAGARAPLVPLHRAAAALTLPLQVRLEACEVDIGNLQDLQPGDVVRLPHRLDAPAAVVGRDGQPLFGGYLVRRRGRKAVELAPVAAAATVTVQEGTP